MINYLLASKRALCQWLCVADLFLIYSSCHLKVVNFLTGEGAPYGVDINTGGIADSFANFVWEPAVVKVSISSFI